MTTLALAAILAAWLHDERETIHRLPALARWRADRWVERWHRRRANQAFGYHVAWSATDFSRITTP